MRSVTEFQRTTIQIEREMEEVLTPERFRAWLEGKDANVTVGYRAVAASCPVATYLCELGFAMPHVEAHCVDSVNDRCEGGDDDEYGDAVVTPPLAIASFIDAIDEAYDGVPNGPIRAGDALSILREVPHDA